MVTAKASNSRTSAGLLAVLLAAATGMGSTALGESLPAITAGDLRAQIGEMRALVAACAAKAEACDSGKVANDGNVGEPGKDGGYAQHWIWLRTTLDEARKAKPDERATEMKGATARLDELESEAKAPATAPPAESNARRQVDAILARPEFQHVKGTSWMDRFAARFWQAINSLFNGVGKVGRSTPWIGPLLEWVFFLGAAAGLAFVMLRALAQQRLQVKLSAGSSAHAAIWDRESTDWAEHAEKCAAAHNWREALHGLYWAAILNLESRRMWRHDPSRTPREYVRLLAPGSEQREALAKLTRIFERAWYGLESSNGEEYREARALYERLATASAQSPSAPEIAAGEAA
ncbi:protein of unknown function [Bryocella elongata]|uniref:Protein-glutamine gamma-glutamyltransferase-like C-terminal domain-containing protein n=1 Tax=Bryocella elongata TaxID=863522 RepID=A0A1H6AF14_9BACT|nr:DUF4129 domain-containing protein [Bryocella elongata]SEG47359.1 protein of unknown function [Bryocella elongata]